MNYQNLVIDENRERLERFRIWEFIFAWSTVFFMADGMNFIREVSYIFRLDLPWRFTFK